MIFECSWVKNNIIYFGILINVFHVAEENEEYAAVLEVDRDRNSGYNPSITIVKASSLSVDPKKDQTK